MLKHLFSATQATPEASPRREAGIQVKFTTAANHFKRIISYLIIISLLLADTAFCMRRTVVSQPYEVGQEERNKASFRRLSGEFPKKSIPLTDGKVRERSRSLDDLTSSMDVEKDSSSSYSSSYMSLSDGDIHEQGSRSPSDNSSNLTPNGSPTHSSTIDVEQRSPSVSPQSDNIFPKLLIEPRPSTSIHSDETIQEPLQVKEVVKEIVGNAELIIESKKQLMLLSSLQNRLEDHVIARMANNVEYYLALSSLRQVQDEEREQQPQEEDQHQADLAKTSTQHETLEVKREEKPNDKRLKEDEASSSDEESEQDEFAEALDKALNQAALKEKKTSSALPSAPKVTETSRLLPPSHHQSNPVGIMGSIQQEPQNPEENEDGFIMIGTGQSVSNYLNAQNLNIQKSGNVVGNFVTTLKNAWKNLRAPKAEKRPSTENHNGEADPLIPEDEESDLHPKVPSQNPNLLDQHPTGEQDPLLLIREDSASNSHQKQQTKISSLFSSDDEDLEGGRIPVIPNLPEDIDPKVLAFLRYAKDYINDGKITLKQGLLGGIFGTAIGIGVGNAMPPIFLNGIEGIGNKFHYELVWNPAIADTFTTHTAVTLGIDSISRNVMIIGDLAGPTMEEFSILPKKVKYRKVEIDPRKGALILVYVSAGLAAFLPVYYLWRTEESDVESDPAHKSNYLTFFWCLAPTLWIDALFSNGRALKQWVDQKFNDSLIAQTYAGNGLSSARITRRDELSRFDDLERLFKYTPDAEIHEFYEQVLTKGFKIEKNGIDFPTDTIKAADALRTLQVLRQIHKDYEIPEKVEENWKKATANILSWGIPTIATFGRSLVFYAIINHLLGDLGLSSGVASTTLSVVFGGIIGSLLQGKVEVDAIKAGVYDLLFVEETDGDTSQNCLWKGLRKVGKGYNYVQGAWNTLPYILVGIAATSGWSVALQAATLAFFGLADMFNNTMSFHESYGGVISGIESLASYKYTTAGSKRAKLIKLVRRYKNAYKTMSPGVLMKVDAMLENTGKNPVLDHIQSEIPSSFSLEKKKGESTSEDSF